MEVDYVEKKNKKQKGGGAAAAVFGQGVGQATVQEGYQGIGLSANRRPKQNKNKKKIKKFKEVVASTCWRP